MTSLPSEIAAALEQITPHDEHLVFARYGHGGGRLFRQLPDESALRSGERTLILDVYQEGDRELYFKAVDLLRRALVLLSFQQAEIARLQGQMSELIGKWTAQAAHKDSFHATMGVGWKACARDLQALLPPVPSAPHPAEE